MSYLIDTHCHLHDREFFTEAQAEEMLAHAQEKNVRKIICIGTNHDDSLAAAEFAASHDDAYWTYGIHPEYATDSKDWRVLSAPIFPTSRLDFSSTSYAGSQAAPSLRDGPVRPVRNIRGEKSNHVMTSEKQGAATRHCMPVAIGEVGLDYHCEGYDRAAQIRLFEQMLQLAVDNDLPLSFHVREAFDDFFPIVANFPGARGVVHSFTDSKKTLKRILSETDFYVGVNGLATYSTLPTPPLDRILLETDAPFLTPKPFRGIINEPAYVSAVALWLATKLGLDHKIIEEETTKNANQLFKL